MAENEPVVTEDPVGGPWGDAMDVILCLFPLAFLVATTLLQRIRLPTVKSLPMAAALMWFIRLAYLSSRPNEVTAAVIIDGTVDTKKWLHLLLRCRDAYWRYCQMKLRLKTRPCQNASRSRSAAWCVTASAVPCLLDSRTTRDGSSALYHMLLLPCRSATANRESSRIGKAYCGQKCRWILYQTARISNAWSDY